MKDEKERYFGVTDQLFRYSDHRFRENGKIDRIKVK